MKKGGGKVQEMADPRGYDPVLEQMIQTDKVQRHFWSTEEEDKLRRYYGKVDTHKLADQIGVSYFALTRHASQLGISFRQGGKA